MNDAAFRSHLDRLKTAIATRDLAFDLGLHSRGRRFFCPSCQSGGGKTPDLAVTDRGFKCFKCGAVGDIIDLIVLTSGMSKAAAIKYLEQRTGIAPDQQAQNGEWFSKGRSRSVDPGANTEAIFSSKVASKPNAAQIRQRDAVIETHADLYATFLKNVCQPIQGTAGADYIEGRGIAVDVADRYGVRFCADLSGLWSLADRKTIKEAGLSSLYLFQKADLPFLVFPYIRNGKPIFIKSRCLLSKDEVDQRELPRFLNTGGAVPCLWNHDAVAAADEVLICEGEIDALSAIVNDMVAVGLPGWSHWKDAWTKDFAGKDTVLVLDADQAGRKGTADIVSRFIKAGLPCPRQLELPEGQDLNDYLRGHE